MQKTLNLEKIQSQLTKLNEIAITNKWQVFVDKSIDNFYFSPNKIDSKFSLHQLDDDFYIYADKDSNLGGIFVEYFNANLVQHDKAVAPLKQIVKNNMGKDGNVKLDKNTRISVANTIAIAILQKRAEHSGYHMTV
jgi:hypothetical protein